MWTSLIVIALAAPAQAPDQAKLVEVLRDAQAAHRKAWAKGRADVRVEVRDKTIEKPALLEGEVTWLDESSILRYKVTDPEGIQFRSYGPNKDRDWNYVVKSPDIAITYLSRRNILHERPPKGNFVLPYYEVSPRAAFTKCCPPMLATALPFDRLIGPLVGEPQVFKGSTYTYRLLTNGDIEQTRDDKTGHRLLLVFSAADEFAIRTFNSFTPDAKVATTIEYTYARDAKHRLVPATCTLHETQHPTTVTGWKYIYTNVKIPGDVTVEEFDMYNVMDLIRKTTPYGKSTEQRRAPDEPVAPPKKPD